MSNIVESLRKHFAGTSEEELEKEWKELEHWNNVGPTIDEYMESLKNADKERIEYCENEIHKLELSGEWKNNKEKWRYLKKNLKYWKHHLEELERM